MKLQKQSLSVALAMILAGAGAAMAAEMTADQIMAASGKTDDTSFCGTKPITLGIHDGFGINGQIPLDQGLRRPPKWKGEWTLTSPPAVYRDLVIVGSSIADNSRLDMTSGEVRAFDAKSGALRWTFHPLPADSPAGGANTWSRLTVDEASGLVYLPTGSASPDYFGGNRPGDNAHANSVAALKAAKPGEIAIAYKRVVGGAELTYRTNNAKLVAALHQWFEAQLSDHGTDAMAGHQHGQRSTPSSP